MMAVRCEYSIQHVDVIEDEKWSCSMIKFDIKAKISFGFAEHELLPATMAWYLERDVVMHDQLRSEAEIRTMLSSTIVEDWVKDDHIRMVLDAARSMSSDTRFSGQKVLGLLVLVDVLMFNDDEEDDDDNDDWEPEFKPFSRESIEELQNFKIGALLAEQAKGGCCICCEDFKIGSEATNLPCCHLFHGICIIKWLQTSRSCPLCRFQL